MKKILLGLFLITLTFVLCYCKSQYKKYQEEILNKLPLQISENVSFPLITDDGLYTIRWNSQNPEIINNLGFFTKPEKSKEVVLEFKLVENQEVVYEGYFRLIAVGYMPE